MMVQDETPRSGSPRMLLNASRQSGKSTVSAALAVWTALYEPGALALLLSPALRQSQELFRKCLDFYRAADQAEPPEAESALRLELANGSRIVSLPGKEGTIRGYSGVRLLIVVLLLRKDSVKMEPDTAYQLANVESLLGNDDTPVLSALLLPLSVTHDEVTSVVNHDGTPLAGRVAELPPPSPERAL